MVLRFDIKRSIIRIIKNLGHNLLRTFTESVRDNVSQLNVGIRETVLVSVLFTGLKAGQFETVAHKVTELTDVSRRHKAAGNKIMLELVSNPFRILLVSFLTTDSLNVFRMCKDIGTVYS